MNKTNTEQVATNDVNMDPKRSHHTAKKQRTTYGNLGVDEYSLEVTRQTLFSCGNMQEYLFIFYYILRCCY